LSGDSGGQSNYLQKGGEPKSQFIELEHKIKLAIERRQIEEQLRNSERRLSDIINFLPDATFAIDITGRVIAWNQAMEVLSGTLQQEVLGKGENIYSLLVHGVRRPALIDLILHGSADVQGLYPFITRKGDRLLSECHIKRPGAREIYASLIASPLFDAEGKIIGAIESVRDITERKAAEEELHAAYEQLAATEEELRQQYDQLAISERIIREDEQKISDIFDFLPDATFAIDMSGTIIAWNRAMEEMMHIPASAALGTNSSSYAEKITGSSRKLLIDRILTGDIGTTESRFIRSGDRLITEARARNLNDGKGAYLWIVASPLYNADHQIIGAIESIRDITDKKRAEDELKGACEQITAAEEELRQQYCDLAASEQALRENERRLSDIINFLPDATFVIDTEGVVIAWNRAIEQVTGIPNADIIGTGNYSYSVPFHGDRRPFLLDQILHPDPAHEAIYPFVKRNGDVLISELNAPALNKGSGAYLWLIASPLYDGEGRIIGAIESLRDISERKITEQEIRAAYEQLAATEEELRQQYEELSMSEEKIREDEQFLKNIICSIRDGITVLDKDLTILRVNPATEEMHPGEEGLVGKKCYEAYYHRSTPCEHCPVLQSLKTGEPAHDIRAEGTKRWTDLYSYPLIDTKTGRMHGVIEYARDISDIIMNEELVRKNEDRYRGLMEICPDPMILLDTNLNTLTANKKTLEMGGYEDLQELIEQGKLGFIRPSDRHLVHGFITSLLKTGISESTEFLFIQKSGEVLDVECTWSLLMGKGGSFVGIIGTLRDISERKRENESIRLVNDKLHLMNTITRHDILNKLTTIFMNLDLALDTCDDRDLKRLLSNQKQAAEAIRHEITFTKSYQDEGIHTPQWQNLKDVIFQATKNQDLGSVQLQVQVDDLEIYADDLLEKVFYNLVDNALKYGETLTRISLGYALHPDGIVIFCEDDGVGIPTPRKEDIFTRQYFKNSGFGLFLTQKILSITGLFMKETGTPGKGSRFEIFVPDGSWRYADAGNDL